MRNYLLLVAICSSISVFAQIEEVRRITQTLCSPEFHGRGYYQHGDSIAASFLVKEFEKLGVQPFKKQGYLQSFPIEGVNVFDGQADVTHGTKQLTPGVHFLIDPSSAGIRKELFPVVLDGTKLYKNGGLDEAYLGQVIRELRESKERNAVLVDLSQVTGDTLKSLMGLSEALAEGFPVIEVMNRKFTWSVGRNQLANPLIFVQDSIYQKGEKFTVAIDATFLPSYQSQNVIARIPAKKKCAKTIVFSAHYDHLGRMGSKTYFPGANDNASGTAMLFTMARYFKEHPSNYNIVFIAFAGEEAGLVGSKYFVEHPWLKLKEIEFLINLDIMGSGEEGVTAVNATLFEEQFNLLTTINEEQQLLSQVKSRGPAANSDHYWFTNAGVPAFFIYTMGPNKNYHDVFDKYEALSFEEYHDITSLLVQFVERLSVK